MGGSGVLGGARESADLSGGDGGALESGRLDFAASVSVGTAISKRLEGALELALEVDPFALGVGVAKCGGADTLASGSARSSDVVPHAIGGLVVAVVLVVEADVALKNALLSGVEVDAGAGLLDALGLAGELTASCEAGGLSGIPDAGRIGVAREETLRLASVLADVEGGVPAACDVRCAGVHGEIDARLLAVSGGTNNAIGFGVALGLLGGSPAVGASVLAGAVGHLALRTAVAIDDGGQLRALFGARLALGVPEAERVGGAGRAVDVLDGAAACAVHSGGDGRSDALRIGLALKSVEVLAVSAADLSDGIPDGVVEGVGDTILAGGVADFGNGDALLSGGSREVADDAARVAFAFGHEAGVACGDADHVGRFPGAAGVVDALSLSRDDFAARLADFVGGVPSAALNDGVVLAARESGGGSLASLTAGTVGGEPLADAGVHVTFGVGCHEFACLLADELVSVPDAARIGLAVGGVAVSGFAAAFADVVAPVAKSVERAVLFGQENIAWSEASSLVGDPLAHGLDGFAVGLSGELELALELTLGEGDVPSAHWAGEA